MNRVQIPVQRMLNVSPVRRMASASMSRCGFRPRARGPEGLLSMHNLFIEATQRVPEAVPASKLPEVGYFGLRETESEAVSLNQCFQLCHAGFGRSRTNLGVAPSLRLRPLLEPSGSFHQPFPLRFA